jgi:hypothetical protein
MTGRLLTCPEVRCQRAWFLGPDAHDFVLQHLRRSHGHSEASALDALLVVDAARDARSTR